MVGFFALTCRALVTAVFLVAVVSKLRSRAAFAAFVDSLRGLPEVPAGRERFAGMLTVAVEAAIVLLVASPVPGLVRLGFLLAAGLLAVLAVVTAVALARGAVASCRCFGAAARPLGWPNLLRDGLLAAFAAAGAAAGTGGPAGYWATPGGTPAGGVLVALAAGAVGALLVVLLDDLAGLFVGSPRLPVQTAQEK